MKWELWSSKVDRQDLGDGGQAAHLGKLGPGHQAEGADPVLCEDLVSGVLTWWTMKRGHPGSPSPQHLCPELSTYLWLLQRAVISDREQLDPCTCGSFSPASVLASGNRVGRRRQWQPMGSEACC